MKTITSIKAIFIRYGSIERVYCDTVEDAKVFLADGNNDGQFVPIAILNDNGDFWTAKTSIETDEESAHKAITSFGYTAGRFRGSMELYDE